MEGDNPLEVLGIPKNLLLLIKNDPERLKKLRRLLYVAYAQTAGPDTFTDETIRNAAEELFKEFNPAFEAIDKTSAIPQMVDEMGKYELDPKARRKLFAHNRELAEKLEEAERKTQRLLSETRRFSNQATLVAKARQWLYDFAFDEQTRQNGDLPLLDFARLREPVLIRLEWVFEIDVDPNSKKKSPKEQFFTEHPHLRLFWDSRMIVVNPDFSAHELPWEKWSEPVPRANKGLWKRYLLYRAHVLEDLCHRASNWQKIFPANKRIKTRLCAGSVDPNNAIVPDWIQGETMIPQVEKDHLLTVLGIQPYLRVGNVLVVKAPGIHHPQARKIAGDPKYVTLYGTNKILSWQPLSKLSSKQLKFETEPL